jgi:hypothetical protein
MVLSVEQAEGCVHDFRLYKDRTGCAVSRDMTAKTDSGYQGIAAYHANSEVPYKKSKSRPLTDEEKAFNRRLARERIVINREIKQNTSIAQIKQNTSIVKLRRSRSWPNATATDADDTNSE